MARVDVKMPDEFLERMSRLGSNFDFIAETVLQAGGEVVLAKTQSNLSSVIGSDTKYDSRATGELESSLGHRKQKHYLRASPFLWKRVSLKAQRRRCMWSSYR